MNMAKCWFIDLDDSIFEASGGMLHAIHLKMNEFMVREMGLSWEEASRLRRYYWDRYGTTFLGLWKCHGIDPRRFLTETHDFDPAPFIHVEGNPAEDLRGLNGRRVVFTNGPRIYAERVLSLLGIEQAVDDLVSSTDMRLFNDWRPKPSRSMLLTLCRRYGVSPSAAVMIDDSPMNLKAAHSIGLGTVWCTGYRRRHDKLNCRQDLPYVDFAVTHLREVRRLPINTKKQCLKVSKPSIAALMRSVD